MAMLLDSFQKVNQFEEMVAMHMQLLSIHGLYPIFISTHYHCFIKQTTMKRELGKIILERSLKVKYLFCTTSIMLVSLHIRYVALVYI